MAPDADTDRTVERHTVWLIGLAASNAFGYAVLLWLSWKFNLDRLGTEKPTVWMITLFGMLFVDYWVATWLAVRLPSTRLVTVIIFAGAVLFRVIMLPSIPMHEIDVYRYIWDGAVLGEGISPYRYTPNQVLEAVNTGGAPTDPTLQQLVDLQASSRSLQESLFTIHYGEYPSPYPIVSQTVFVWSAKLTPDSVSKHSRLIIMKGLLVLFDLATLVLVILLLRDVGLHPGWSLAYGWCPLLMKEIANSGHLDSIAIFLTTLAVWLLVKSSARLASGKIYVAASALALALAIGAKLYPVVLVPLFVAVWLRRQGWKAACLGLLTTALFSVALLYPLFGPTRDAATLPADQQANSTDQTDQTAADEGIRAFLKHWEMNDLIFMLVVENLRQQNGIAPAKKPWFVITSAVWSEKVVTQWVLFKQKITRVDEADRLTTPLLSAELRTAAFSLARAITGGVFFIVACLLAWLAAGKNDPQAWCRVALLTLAWFWLTCPTQNPWYWCWVLPFLPFAHYRTWHVVGAATMLYYLRFWLIAHYQKPPTLGTAYDGEYFFYFVVAWVEFLPILVALVAEWLCRPRATKATSQSLSP